MLGGGGGAVMGGRVLLKDLWLWRVVGRGIWDGSILEVGLGLGGGALFWDGCGSVPLDC